MKPAETGLADLVKIRMFDDTSHGVQYWACWLPYAALDFERRIKLAGFLWHAEQDLRLIEMACYFAQEQGLLQPHTLLGLLYCWEEFPRRYRPEPGVDLGPYTDEALSSAVKDLREIMAEYAEYADIISRPIPPPTGEEIDWESYG